MADKAKKKTTKKKNLTTPPPDTANIIRQGVYKYLPGHKFGLLTILKRKKGDLTVPCRCDCGNKTTIALKHLVSGSTKSCGCIATGRPTAFKPEYIKRAEELCYLGATDQQMADSFEVSKRTILNWKQQYPEFLRLIQKAKVKADSSVAKSLFKRAEGFTRMEEKVVVIDGKLQRIKFEKYYPPDTVAAVFWLGNRNQDEWRKSEKLDITVERGDVIKTRAELDSMLLKIDEDEGIIDIEPVKK